VDGPLHILVNNAGVMALPERTLTAAGHELQFAPTISALSAWRSGLHRPLRRLRRRTDRRGQLQRAPALPRRVSTI